MCAAEFGGSCERLGVLMHALVTGVAGFVGSHLVEALVGSGYRVTGIDSLVPYYDLEQKKANLSQLEVLGGFDFVEADLNSIDLVELLENIDVVFHQAGQPGVRASWSEFPSYIEHNVNATHRLLEATGTAGVGRFVYASSSSVYGDALAYPTTEQTLPLPKSPYGVSKLAAEHLCGVYARNWGLPTVSLRYFTVYGPRQRPDMAMHRLVEAALSGQSFPLFGTGEQIRDFTFVDDVVAANLAAAQKPLAAGTVLNIAGGSATTMLEVIDLVEQLTDKPVELDRRPEEAGDVGRTSGAINLASELLGWRPKVTTEEGLARQVDWHRRRRS